MSLAEIGKRMGRRTLEDVAQIVRPETILGWHRKLIARQLDNLKSRSMLGRPTAGPAIEDLVLRFARENRRLGDTGGSLVLCAIWGTKSAIRR